jgi:glutathione synthase/RimK-type ligase-like ATP-grasp enzyme
VAEAVSTVTARTWRFIDINLLESTGFAVIYCWDRPVGRHDIPAPLRSGINAGVECKTRMRSDPALMPTFVRHGRPSSRLPSRLQMLNSQRIFVDSVRKYCQRHGIAMEMKSHGWLIVMQRGSQRRLAFGYDLGLNSSVTHRVANDKAATAEVLELSGVPCVPHTLFLKPELNAYVPPVGSWEAMLGLLHENPGGIVVKPNEGTSGQFVFKVTAKPKLELAVHKIFARNLSVAISPFLDIEDEVRVVLMDDQPIVVYSKRRPSVVGDGKRSLLEIALATISADKLSAVLPGMVNEFDQAALDQVVPQGQRHALNWRHNLDSGAEPVLLEPGATRETCIRIATEAAKAIHLQFGSVDLVRVDGAWRILEINSGVMMEALSRSHPELVDAAYTAALDRVFAGNDASI